MASRPSKISLNTSSLRYNNTSFNSFQSGNITPPEINPYDVTSSSEDDEPIIPNKKYKFNRNLQIQDSSDDSENSNNNDNNNNNINPKSIGPIPRFRSLSKHDKQVAHDSESGEEYVEDDNDNEEESQESNQSIEYINTQTHHQMNHNNHNNHNNPRQHTSFLKEPDDDNLLDSVRRLSLDTNTNIQFGNDSTTEESLSPLKQRVNNTLFNAKFSAFYIFFPPHFVILAL